MANWASTAYAIEGEHEVLQKIYDAIIASENNSDGNKPETEVLSNLGIEYRGFKINEQPYDLRGAILPESWWWDENTGALRFAAEEAWGVSDFKDVLLKDYPDLKIFYVVEEGNDDVYATNDAEGKYFPDRFFVDTCIDGEYKCDYFKTKEAAFEWISMISDCQTEEDIDYFNDERAMADMDDFISVHEFSVIE